MVRPLYDSLARATVDLGTGHAGLWYDKLCDRWSDDWTLGASPDSDSRKLDWIETVTKSPLGSKDLLEEVALRTVRLAIAKGGVFGLVVSESRFVTGLGRSHPVESGFAWHPTLGVPYLPGSSVKGILRSWAEEGIEPRSSREALSRAFGVPGVVGAVDVLDLLPISPVCLDADVITPHYAGWTPEDPPADWRRPVPVPFLVTAAGTSFLFALLPTTPAGREHLDTLRSWLLQALQSSGAGAKTSVGYGRFRLDESESAKWARRVESIIAGEAEHSRRAELAKTPEGRWQLDLQLKTEREILELVRVHLSKQPLPDPDDRRAFAEAVAATGLPAVWAKGNKRERETQVGAAKLKERAKLVREAIERRDSA